MVSSFAWCVLYVDDVAASSSFYSAAFGLSLRFITEEADYAEFETGQTALALCSRSLGVESTGLDLVEHRPMSNVTFVVEDVQSAWDVALTHGAIAQKPPMTKPWGQTSAYVLDPDGHVIELATRVMK
jgi:lactoylglutathione lyase